MTRPKAGTAMAFSAPRRLFAAHAVLFFLLWSSIGLANAAPVAGTEEFLATLAPGLEYGTVPWIDATPHSDSLLHVVRCDPERWRLRAFSTDSASQTTTGWAKAHDLTFVTNAGMYGTDGFEHVGYFRIDGDVRTSYIHPRYESVLVTDPVDPADAPIAILDLDRQPLSDILTRYGTVIQNLRLIRSPGENRWSPQTRRWSEMAVAEDGAGRILFLFTPIPITMEGWNDWLLSLPLDIRSAQHLEGGSDAQFYLRVGDFEVRQSGHTRLGLGVLRTHGSALPNVLGLDPRPEVQAAPGLDAGPGTDPQPDSEHP